MTDFEKAKFVAKKANEIKGGYKLTPEDVLGICRSSAELEYYYISAQTATNVRICKGGDAPW